MTLIMGHIDGHRLTDPKAEEGSSSGRLIIVGGLDIGGSLQIGRDSPKRIGTVNIDLGSGLEARGGHIRLPTSDRQV